MPRKRMEKTLPPVPVEPEVDDATVLELFDTLSPLEQRYLAERLVDPSRDPNEVLNDLRIPAQAAYRWKFPAQVEARLARMPQGTQEALAKSIIRKFLPKASQTLIELLDSPTEKVRHRAAVDMLKGAGVLESNAPTINIGGDHRSISVRAAELWRQQQEDDYPPDDAA